MSHRCLNHCHRRIDQYMSIGNRMSVNRSSISRRRLAPRECRSCSEWKINRVNEEGAVNPLAALAWSWGTQAGIIVRIIVEGIPHPIKSLGEIAGHLSTSFAANSRPQPGDLMPYHGMHRCRDQPTSRSIVSHGVTEFQIQRRRKTVQYNCGIQTKFYHRLNRILCKSKYFIKISFYFCEDTSILNALCIDEVY